MLWTDLQQQEGILALFLKIGNFAFVFYNWARPPRPGKRQTLTEFPEPRRRAGAVRAAQDRWSRYCQAAAGAAATVTSLGIKFSTSCALSDL